MRPRHAERNRPPHLNQTCLPLGAGPFSRREERKWQAMVWQYCESCVAAGPTRRHRGLVSEVSEYPEPHKFGLSMACLQPLIGSTVHRRGQALLVSLADHTNTPEEDRTLYGPLIAARAANSNLHGRPETRCQQVGEQRPSAHLRANIFQGAFLAHTVNVCGANRYEPKHEGVGKFTMGTRYG